MAAADSRPVHGAEPSRGFRGAAAVIVAGLLVASNAGANIPRVPFTELAPAPARSWAPVAVDHASHDGSLKFLRQLADENGERDTEVSVAIEEATAGSGPHEASGSND